MPEDWPVWITTALLAMILLAAGGTQFTEAIRLSPLIAYSEARWLGRPTPPLPADIRAWQPEAGNGRLWAHYSQTMLAKAEAEPDPAQREALIRQSLAAVEQALRLSPAQPSAWARLALLHLNLGEPRRAADALALSLWTGPAAQWLAWPRAQLGLHLWDRLAPPVQAGIAKDICAVWLQPPSAALAYPRHALIRFAHSMRRLDAVGAALPEGEQTAFTALRNSVAKEADDGN